MPHWWYRGIRIPDDYELNPVKIVGREEWGAVPPTETKYLKKPIRTLVFAFNTEMDTCVNKEECVAAMRDMQKRHMDLGYPDIYYNFAVGGDGRVYEGRGWDAWHSANYSCYYGRTLVVGIIGQGIDDQNNWYPPFRMTLRKLDLFGRDKGWITHKRKLKTDYEKVIPYSEMVKLPMRSYWYRKPMTDLEQVKNPKTRDDEQGDWYPAYGSGTIKIFRDAEENHKFPYFEKDKMVFMMHDRIGPYDKNSTKEIDLVPYDEEVPTEAEDGPCGLLSSEECDSEEMKDLLKKDLTNSS